MATRDALRHSSFTMWNSPADLANAPRPGGARKLATGDTGAEHSTAAHLATQTVVCALSLECVRSL